MRPRARTAALALAALLAASAAAEDKIVPFVAPSDFERIAPRERTLWGLGAEADVAIAKAGLAFDDPELDAYLQRICDRLFPEFNGAIRARAMRSTQVNAFMQPNGSTYMFVGMLNFLDNEAQLAAIMAHEGAHFVDRHGYRGYKSASSMAVFGTLVSLGGVPIAGELMAASSIMGFSRSMEATADEMGLERMLKAGYDIREAKRPFMSLVVYLKANKVKEPFFFADHPRLQDRVEFFERNESRQSPAGGELNREEYLRVTERARLYALEEEVKRRNFRTVIHLLEDEARLAALPAHARYFLGVAYRQRNQADDVGRATAVFERTLADAPAYAPTYKALGELLMRQAETRARARALFERYLELAPNAADRGYVQNHLAKLNAPGDAR